MKLPIFTPDYIESISGAASTARIAIPSRPSFVRLLSQLMRDVRLEDDGNVVLSRVEWKGRNRQWIAVFRKSSWTLERASLTRGPRPKLPGDRLLSNLTTAYKVQAAELIRRCRDKETVRIAAVAPLELRSSLKESGGKLLFRGSLVHHLDGTAIRVSELKHCQARDLALGFTAAHVKASPDSVRKAIQRWRKRGSNSVK